MTAVSRLWFGGNSEPRQAPTAQKYQQFTHVPRNDKHSTLSGVTGFCRRVEERVAITSVLYYALIAAVVRGARWNALTGFDLTRTVKSRRHPLLNAMASLIVDLRAIRF
jgi:hypothetical protein